VGDEIISGTVDVTKIKYPLVMRLIDYVDPEGKDDSLSKMKTSLGLTFSNPFYRLVTGESLGGMKVWIKENLLNQSFVWSRPWVDNIRLNVIEKEIPNPITPFFRALQVASIELSQGQFQLSLADTVPEIRRYPLGTVWKNELWGRLRSKLKPLQGRVVID